MPLLQTLQPIGQTPHAKPTRRLFMGLMGGAASAAALALAGCASYSPFSLVEAVRRLLKLSANRAFARLLAPGGFYDDQMFRLELPDALGRRGGILEQILTGPLFKQKLQRAFNDMASRAAYNAAPAVTEAVRTIGVSNALALLRGQPDEATRYLRGAMGDRLIDIMLPEFGDALHMANDPLIGQALSALSGVDVTGVANSLAHQADDAIWRAIAREEQGIRADPRATNDPVLITAFGAG